jgi:hypothetical protein
LCLKEFNLEKPHDGGDVSKDDTLRLNEGPKLSNPPCLPAPPFAKGGSEGTGEMQWNRELIMWRNSNRRPRLRVLKIRLLDLHRADLKFRDLRDGIEGGIGQHIGRALNKMEIPKK